VTSQIIAGFSPPVEAAAPALTYLNDHLYLMRNQTLTDKVKQKISNLFRAASNLFGGLGNSSEGWLERFLNLLREFRRRCQEFDYREIVSWFRRSRHIQVQPLHHEQLPS
jgi:hypothetical protein